MKSRLPLLPLFCCALLFAQLAFAAVPVAGTLNAPASGGSSSVSWTGGPYTAATPDPTACTSLNCDSYTLTVNVPATFYAANPTYDVHVRLNWADSTNDFDLYVNDSSGNQVCSSGQGSTNFEDANCGQLPSGVYTVQVVAFTVVNSSYSGSATVAAEPAAQVGSARYKKSDATFSAGQELTRPPNPANATGTILTADQDVEPRVVRDSLGNLYVAAIEGVPGGVDMWKSVDGGGNWQYIGEPDGLQIGSTLGVDGVGLGGGDEDLAVSPSGVVYMNSLWLGSDTQATSFDGGLAWAVNPYSSDVPIVDREWIAPHGDHELYFTSKQEGALEAGFPFVFVAKSFDNGVTWPQFTVVTTPDLGLQPGDQGNITVNQSNGYVYTVFVNNGSNQLWLARSTDGGATFVNKLVYQVSPGVSLAHVFPIVAVDAAGNVYISFSDGHNVFLTGSKDNGATWTVPVRVNNGSDTKTAIGAWITAGSAGKVNVTFWGTPSGDFNDPSAQWKVVMAQTQNFFAKTPTFTQAPATGIMHVGPICVNGTACASGTRNMAEYFATDVDASGNLLLVYPDDKNSHSPSGQARTWFAKQVGGSTVK